MSITARETTTTKKPSDFYSPHHALEHVLVEKRGKRVRSLEYYISTSARASLDYSRYVLGGKRFEVAEKTSLQKYEFGYYLYIYIREVLNVRSPHLEEHFLKDPRLLILYMAKINFQDRFPKAELKLLKLTNPQIKNNYIGLLSGLRLKPHLMSQKFNYYR